MTTSYTFDEDKHLYRLLDGKIIPGHTRVLDLGGLVPYKNIEADILERKAAIGREAHLACLLHDQKKELVCDPRVVGYLKAWQRFREESGFIPFLLEHREIYTIDGLIFGMQIDRIGRLVRELREAVIEIKTCATVMPHHGVQLAAQAAGVPLKGTVTPLAKFLARDRFVCQLRENGTYRLHPFKERTDFQQFRNALSTTYWKMAHEKFYSEVKNGDSEF